MIEFMSAGGFDQRQFANGDPAATSANVRDMGHLARSHQDITILFMDIVGEPSKGSWYGLVYYIPMRGCGIEETAAGRSPPRRYHAVRDHVNSLQAAAIPDRPRSIWVADGIRSTPEMTCVCYYRRFHFHVEAGAARCSHEFPQLVSRM